jgi:hypothetical protein
MEIEETTWEIWLFSGKSGESIDFRYVEAIDLRTAIDRLELSTDTIFDAFFFCSEIQDYLSVLPVAIEELRGGKREF